MNQIKPMRVVKLEISNIKRVSAVEIVPGQNAVTLTGANEQGKSSILDSIEYALSGGKSICEQPLRKGAKSGYVVVDLGDIIVERTFTASGNTSLTIKSKATETKLARPQDLLDSLCSKVAFDPLEFTELKPQDQADTLKKLVGLDFTELDADKKKAYDERTVNNRLLQQKEGSLSQLPVIADAPESEVSMQDLVNQLNLAKSHNQSITDLDAAVKGADDDAVEIADDIKNIEKEMAELDAKLKSKQQALNLTKQFASDKASERARMLTIDEKEISDKMATIEQSNAKFRQAQKRKEVFNEVAELRKKSEDLTKIIDDTEALKQDLVAKAKFPIPGLSFDEVGVMLNGLPFSQGSQARQLQAAIAIGMALNPTVRIILIRNAAVLDDASMEMVKDMAEKNDYQCWFECIRSDDPTAIEIKDGKVAE